MINTTSPETAHTNTTVISRMGEHVTILDPDKTFCIIPQGFLPGKDHPEKGHKMLKQTGFESGRVAHLYIDIEMIIPLPRR